MVNNVQKLIFSYDVCEIANILAYSFGEEGLDRCITIFKKEFAPTEDHLNALRKGEEWNEEIAKKVKEKRERLKKTQEIKSKNQKSIFTPHSNYKDKYEHLIGKDAALQAARKTEANSNYGCGKIIENFKIFIFLCG